MRSRDESHEIIGAGGAGIQPGRIGFAGAEAGVEAEEAEDSQMVLGDALEWLADEADPALGQIGEATEIIEDLAGLGVGEQRVDREVAAGGVGLPIVGKGDGRPAAVGRDVMAQRGDLERMAVADRSDGAMIDAGRNGLGPRSLEPTNDLVGQNSGGEIHVVDGEADQLVAHGAADIAGKALVGAERVEHGRGARQRAPLGRVQPQLHCSRRDRLTMIAAVAPQILRPSQGIS